MGIDSRRHILPAPTDSSTLESNGGSVVDTDLATDLTRQDDEKTSFSIPDDGSPITITTQKRGDKGHGKISKSHHHSQTSLLIEYFEGGKGGPEVRSRPSVRVKVTPSAARKLKDQGHDHIVVTESKGTRRPSYSRRISLGKTGSTKQIIDGDEVRSLSSYTSAAEDSSLAYRPPIEIELLNKDGSDLSSNLSHDARYIQPASDISSMPPDSMLEGNANAAVPRRERSRSVSREDIALTKDTLKTPSRRRSRSLSRERIAAKVVEKIKNKEREGSSSKRRTSDKTSRSRSISKELLEAETRTNRRKSGKHREEEIPSGAESSLLSNSLLSPRRKEGDQYSFRSGTSKSSITNPKLLETVEDAIRRLILPELKELKKDQKVHTNRNKFERDTNPSTISGSSVSRDDIVRRVSKHASAPDVSKPKVVLHRDSRDSPEILHSGSKRRKERRSKDREYDSPSERSFSRRESGDSTIVEDDRPHSKRDKSHRVRDATAGAMAGGILTAAALQHHDSRGSIEHRERRKKRSKSRSRSASVAESEEIFHKHDVPPMPMRSDIDSELTRESILSEQTEVGDTGTPQHKLMREVVRGSPQEVLSPASRTPTRTPVSTSKGFATHHSNLSARDLREHSRSNPSLEEERYDDEEYHDRDRHHDLEHAAAGGLAGGAGALAADRLMNRNRDAPNYYEDNLYSSHPIRRGLSPIQSVASYEERGSEHPPDSMQHEHSTDSLNSMKKAARARERMSIDSLSSAPSTDLARSKRPGGINLERPSAVLSPHRLSAAEQSYEDSPRETTVDQWYENEHQKNEQYRHSMDDDPKIDVRHMTNYTDDSMDAPYLDKVAAGQEVARGFGANPEYVHTPVAVESAVASLHEPSILETRSLDSGTRSYSGSPRRRGVDSPRSFEGAARDLTISEQGSPLKHRHDASSFDTKPTQYRMGGASPPQSVTESMDDREVAEMGVASHHVVGDPIPDIGHNLDNKGSEESEITTNPSIIRGPIGGNDRGNRDHWPYNPTPPRSQGQMLSPSAHDDRHGVRTAGAGLAGAAIGAGLAATAGERVNNNDHSGAYGDQYDPAENHDFGPIRDTYMSGQGVPTPSGHKDEGYISAANPRSPGATPDFKGKGRALEDDLDDPFSSTAHNRHLSGYSQGMPEQFYDSATGKGIDRIQSKDIVALMDHLTVRDAQRNARDTEILVTLVRSAAEMRNSFEDMKRFIAEQDDLIMDTADKQHDRTQKAIGGPRPQPLGSPRFPGGPPRRNTNDSAMANEMDAKRKNIFKRALRGLGSKNADVGNIEAMLTQLLGEVEGLRAAQEGRPIGNVSRGASYNSNDLQPVAEDGYEPEGQAGTSSTGDRSGYFSNNSSRQVADAARAPNGGRRNSENRVSTVMEGDEDQEPLEPHEQDVLDRQMTNESQLLSPSREMPDGREDSRGGSVPLATPPRIPIPSNTGAHSNENTPRMSSDGKGRKHKSSSSSFFPKISRWSKTTASSVGDNIRQGFQTSSQRKERPYSEVSRSGSDLNGQHYTDYDYYDPQGDDKLNFMDTVGDDDESMRSRTSSRQDNRPHSPLIPSQVSENPKYEAHRNSLNLQHPTPRQAPTDRYQSHLESQAQNFGSPTSVNSEQWGSNPNLLPTTSQQQQQHQQPRASSGYAAGGHLSPIHSSDAGYSDTSSRFGEEEQQQQGPPRPPKVRDDEPLMPARPPKVPIDSTNTGKPTFADHIAARNAGVGYTNNQTSITTTTTMRASSGNQPARKPLTGPRPITSSGTYSPGTLAQRGLDPVAATIKQTRYRGSPNALDPGVEETTRNNPDRLAQRGVDPVAATIKQTRYRGSPNALSNGSEIGSEGY